MSSLNRSNDGYVVKRKTYQKLGLEFLQDHRWCRKRFLFYKVLENENPKYLFSSKYT